MTQQQPPAWFHLLTWLQESPKDGMHQSLAQKAHEYGCVAYLPEDLQKEVAAPGLWIRPGNYFAQQVWAAEPQVEQSPWWQYRGLTLALQVESSGNEEKLWRHLVRLSDLRAKRRVLAIALDHDAMARFAEGQGPLALEIREYFNLHHHRAALEALLLALWLQDADVPQIQGWMIEENGGICTLQRLTSL